MKIALLEDNPAVIAALEKPIRAQGWQLQVIPRIIGEIDSDARVILLDRDAPGGRTFHAMVPGDAWQKVISISSADAWNDLALSRGAIGAIQKTGLSPRALSAFTEQVMHQVDQFSHNDTGWREPEVSRTRGILQRVLKTLCRDVPSLRKRFYWTGTGAVSYEDTGHWVSLDIDLSSTALHANIAGTIRELRRLKYVKPGPVQDEGFFHGVIHTGDDAVHLDLKSSNESVPSLRSSKLVPGLSYEGLQSYLRNKVRCLEERIEPKDWIHLGLLSRDPKIKSQIRKNIHAISDPYLLLPRVNNMKATDFFREFGLRKFERAAVDEFVTDTETLAQTIEARSLGVEYER